MAFNIKEVLTEEIALEGLDGITVNTLWIRLKDRPNFAFSLDDSSKPYLWNCVKDLKGVAFYKLEESRPDLILYNRFHYIDPETKQYLETEHIPSDIYPIKIINKDGVMGSCSTYETRQNITRELRDKNPNLAEVIQEYGNKLVIVASQAIRRETLIGAENDPDFEFDVFSFCILERIARARYNGEASTGKLSLQDFKESPKTMFYMLKKLKPLKVLRKQRLIVVNRQANLKINCFLYHVNRFYREVGNRFNNELLNLSKYLSEKPECMEEVLTTKTVLKQYDIFKKLSQHTMPSGERYFEYVDVPWREKYPDAKPKDYLNKNHRQEKKIRHIRLIPTLKEVEKSLRNQAEKESDDEGDGQEEESTSGSKPEYNRVYDEPNLYQVLQLIRQSGAKGMSQVDLQNAMSSAKLAVRRVLVFLQKTNYVSTFIEDRGRQRIILYVDKRIKRENTTKSSVKLAIQEFETIPMETVAEDNSDTPEKTDTNLDKTDTQKSQSSSSKKKVLKELPKVTFNEEKPSDDKVIEIKQELKLLDENQLIQISPAKMAVKREIMKEMTQDAGVKVVIEELIPEKVIDKKTGKVINGMERFGNMLTDSHIRRANWMLEVVNAIRILESFRLLKLLRNREKEINLSICMDKKSLKRLVYALCEEGKMKSYKASITMDGRTKEFMYLCTPTTTTEDPTLLRMIDEAKLRYFSVSKEELKKRSLQRKVLAKGVKPAKEKKAEIPGIPQSALDTIRNHQEYRKKLDEKAPPMKYDRRAGMRYGLLPKMMRIKSAHQYLFYLSYDTYGNPKKTASKLSASQSNKPKSTDANTGGDSDKSQGSKTEGSAGDEETDKRQPDSEQEPLVDDDRLDITGRQHMDVEDEPAIYCNEMTWRRYLPPVPIHTGFPKGWVLLSDCLLNMPVCLFCEIVNVCYNIIGLEEILEHPKKRYYPVINLPFSVTQQLLHSKKYVQSFSTLCYYMAEMGLLSFGKEVLKEKDQMFIYIHQNATLLDTKQSLKGYNKTKIPEGHVFPEKMYHFETLNDLPIFWEDLQITAVNSNLGCKSMVLKDAEDEVSFEVKSLKQAIAAYTPETVEDDGVLPGDRRGGAGVDSSLFSHTMKNWSNSGVLKPHRKYKKLSSAAELKGGLDVESKREVVDQFNKNRLKGKERLVLSEDPNKPIALKKITKDVAGNRGGKGILRRVYTELTKTYKIINRQEGKFLKKRCIKLQDKVRKRKKPSEKGDKKDKDIYRDRSKMRVVWSLKEDSVLLMCRLAALIMDNTKKLSLISYIRIRDYLHDKCGAVAYDKTSQAVSRRIKFVLKNPQTETNLLLYYREAMQDEFVLKNYVSKEFIMTDTDLESKFRILVEYLLDKFKSLDLQKCSLPDTLEDLRQNFSIQYIGKLQPRKVYTDVKNKTDICQDVLRNILHSAILLQDKQSRTHEMFKLLSQYPDALLSAVVRELRNDGLFVINKKNYLRESVSQLQSGVGLRNFKVSQRYIYNFKHKYLSVMFEESANLIKDLCHRYLHSNGEDETLTLPFHPKSGECAALLPLILNRRLDLKINMPEELVIVDMEGFYKFPWGRGKNSSSQRKGDKMLQEMKGKDKLSENSAGKGKGDEEAVKDTNKATGGKRSETDDLVEDDAIDTEDELSRKTGKEKDKDIVDNGVMKKSTYESTNDGDEYDKELCGQGTSSTKDRDDSDKFKSGKNSESEQNTGSTHISTNHTTVIIPDLDQSSQVSGELPSSASGIASRTMLSLRRAEDCSVDDIRIFNAQDNFVVKSCEIGIKVRKNREEGKSGNPILTRVSANGDQNKGEDIQITTDKTTEVKSVSEASELLTEEKMKNISQLLLDKTMIKNIYADLQRLLPFKIDIQKVWTSFKDEGTSEEDLNLYKKVYRIIDSHGEIGVRYFDLKILGEKYGIGKSTVSDILKKKVTFMEQWENNSSASKFRFNNSCKYDNLNDMVWEWFCKARGKNIPISGVLIQEKAMEFSKEIGLSEFKASNGWLDRWKTRHSVKGFKVCGESGGVSSETVEDYKQRLPEILQEYDSKDIFNCDETGLYFRALPDKTLSVKGQSNKGNKVSKDRVTVLFACSASGEKLKPLVIGKSSNPRCLKNVKRDSLGVEYVANRKAWMNNELFVNWLNGVNKTMKRQGRHILLFLDNASSHGNVKLSNVTLKFLPPNTTSHLQPLDQGIIRTFKALYRKNLLRSLLSVIDNAPSVQALCKQITLLDSIGWIVKSWNDVKVSTIERCFLVAGFCNSVISSSECSASDDEDEYEDDNVPLAVLVAQFSMSVDDVHQLDEGIDTEDSSEEWEKNLVDNYKCVQDDDEHDDDISELDSDEISKPGSDMTHKQVLELVLQIKNFATEKDQSYLKLVQELQTMTEKKIVSMRCSKRQATMDKFVQ